MKRKYELLVVLPSQETEAAKEKFHQILQKFQASVIEEKDWGKKRMYHPIGEESNGIYLLLDIEAETTAMKDLERGFRLEPQVLRTFFTRK